MPINKTVALIALLTIISGSLVLFGWAFNITVLKSILPTWVSMKANAAFCFILIGIMLLSLPTVFAAKFSILLSCVGWFCGLLAGLIGVLTLSEYLFDWNIGIDQWLIHESAGTVGTVYAGRMAPETAWCFVLLATAEGFNTVRSHIVAVSLGLLVLILSLMATLLNVTSAFSIFGIAFGFTQMAFHTAALFMLLSYAVIAMNWRCYDENIPSTSFSRSRLILDTSIIAVIPVVITMALLVLFQLREDTEIKIAIFTQNIAAIMELSVAIFTTD